MHYGSWIGLYQDRLSDHPKRNAIYHRQGILVRYTKGCFPARNRLITVLGTGKGLLVYQITYRGQLVHQKDLSGTDHEYFQVLMIMNLYLDIDGVLLDYATDAPAKNATIFIDFITSEFNCYWLTTHCQGDSAMAVEYLAEYFPPEVVAKLKVIEPTVWRTLKTEGIDFSKPFVWLDDCPFQAEIETLDSKGASDSLFKVNLGNRDELLGVIEFLKRAKAYHFTCTTSGITENNSQEKTLFGKQK